MPGFEGADTERYRLPEPPREQVLRWDTRALHAAMDAQRQAHGMTWKQVGEEIGGFTPGMLTHLASGGRVASPGVMRFVARVVHQQGGHER